MKPTITWYRNRELRAYKIPDSVDEALGPVATYHIEPNDEVQSHATTPNLDCAVYTTRNKVTCVGQDGGPLWCYNLEPHTPERLPRTECIFSLDGNLLWLYRPDAMTDRGPDRLVVLLASTGETVAQAELDTVGQAAQFVQHPDGRHVMLDVGEGQDGVKLFLAALADSGGIDLHSYGWDDRALIDIAPNGQCFMTVDHGRYDVAFHTFPSGEEILRLPITAFGYEDDEEDKEDDSFVDWGGGFLNADIAVVVITGELNDEEWYHYYQVDLRTGKPLGRFEAHSTEIDGFQALGDGTWIASDFNGNPVRHLSYSQ
ncbi:uncharacterized protein N7496_004987 [Penicillium cataractarum]|uniref:Uncharacterized protein n=1 Tax=Penicillium cataractarum TaxID=2100454 RepID=A0A9W9SJQ4_9EURO|nr:uncharacterized protein N7496_004987 [Penicillium cataractarum]KAJ5377578.1 hypothetical protein N7496_004987 [Penicillium cataractarum]